MTAFPEPPKDDYAVLYLEDTDKPLPKKINQSTRYAYFKTIARGGKSIIQSCKDMHLGRVICYKSLRPEFANDPIEQQRFLREARVSAMLQHPSTVPTYEVGRDSRGNYYFTMKLVHGYTLRELLDYRDRYDLKQLFDVLIQIAFALDYAHTHRVAHRDIKPENILVGPFGEVLLLDWGLAKVWDATGAGEVEDDKTDSLNEEPQTSITGQGNLQGTATYMSPEQIRRDPNIDFRTDIFSLGVVMYEVLAGRPPFEADTVSEMIAQVTDTASRKPSEFAPWKVPKLLEDLVMRCMEKSPTARIQSCAEIVRLLQEDWH
ncbi:MAG: serine/threonine protein kinase [Gammaproteobacteria bacterium]